jgi:hypothetical protein
MNTLSSGSKIEHIVELVEIFAQASHADRRLHERTFAVSKQFDGVATAESDTLLTVSVIDNDAAEAAHARLHKTAACNIPAVVKDPFLKHALFLKRSLLEDVKLVNAEGHSFSYAVAVCLPTVRFFSRSATASQHAVIAVQAAV